MRKLILWCATLSLLASALAWHASAEEPKPEQPKINISDADMNVVIEATLGGGATSFSRTVTLTMTGGKDDETKQVQVRRTDLVDTSRHLVIDRGNVSVTATLTNGKPQDVPITINNVTRYGTYEGEIKLWLAGASEDSAQKIKLTIKVAPKIDVKTPNAFGAQVARCTPLPCSLQAWLPSWLKDPRPGMLIDSQTPVELPVSSPEITLRGNKTGRVLTTKDLDLIVEDGKLTPNGSAPVEVRVKNLDDLQPDRYVGAAHFVLKDSEAATVVPFTLDVRDAPWWPLVVLVFGVVVGRLVKNMSSPEAVLQLKLMRRVFRLQGDILSLGSAADRGVLLRQLNDLKRRINDATETEQALTQELEKQEARARLLLRLEALERDAANVTAEPLKQQLVAKISEARGAVLAGRFEDCGRNIAEADTLLQQAGVADIEGEDAQQIRLVRSAIGDAAEEAARVREVHEAPPATPPGRPARLLAAIAGTDLMSAEARFLFWRPLFFLLLLVLLGLLGLKTLYIDAGANFGVEGIYDYLGLFLWGLSADVVQRTLQNLPLPGAATAGR
ncbi:MAG: hypothetical protein LC754_00140 [Acidobacteria bacterium]|nr:hypothetical protein [Acidobacteriota bacterium]